MTEQTPSASQAEKESGIKITGSFAFFVLAYAIIGVYVVLKDILDAVVKVTLAVLSFYL